MGRPWWLGSLDMFFLKQQQRQPQQQQQQQEKNEMKHKNKITRIQVEDPSCWG